MCPTEAKQTLPIAPIVCPWESEQDMPDNMRQPRESTRVWLTGLAVTLTTIVSYLAFWRLSPGSTFVVGIIALLGLIISAWYYGRSMRLNKEQGRELPRSNGPSS